MNISTTAGQNGHYLYDADTDTDVFIPADSNVQKSISVPATADLLTESPLSMAPFSIVGTDNRTKVTHPEDYAKYRNTCLIAARFPNGAVVNGTAWIINNRYLATAGHLAYNSRLGGYAKHVAVYACASGGKYQKYSLGRVHRVGGDYVKNEYDDFTYLVSGMYDDWAVIKLDTEINGLSSFGIYSVNSYEDMKNRTYETQGYPGDRNSSISRWDNYYMYYTSGKITGNKYRFLPMVTTDIDITEGQSGSPIYSYRSGYGYCAEAIVVSQTGTNNLILVNNWLANLFVNLR